MAKVDPKDPRYRKFRGAMYALYLLVVGAFVLAIIVSVVRSVLEMSPKMPADTDVVLTEPECLEQAQVLWKRLDDERKDLTRSHPARKADEDWSHFRVAWLRDLRNLEARCAVDSRNRKALREVFRQLDSIQDLYMTHAVQYAGEIGPAVDKLEQAFTRLREQTGAK